MFSSKISVLSLFVFCLFTLGQGAPVLEDMPSLSTRETPVEFALAARGLLTHLFGKKLDPATEKQVKEVTIKAGCYILQEVEEAKEKYDQAKKDLTTAKDALTAKGTDSKDPVVKEYETQIKKFDKLDEKMVSKAKEEEASLKKLGVTDDAKTHCKTVTTAST